MNHKLQRVQVAIARLTALPTIEAVKEELGDHWTFNIERTRLGQRCSTCPVAAYLTETSGVPVRVSCMDSADITVPQYAASYPERETFMYLELSPLVNKVIEEADAEWRVTRAVHVVDV